MLCLPGWKYEGSKVHPQFAQQWAAGMQWAVDTWRLRELGPAWGCMHESSIMGNQVDEARETMSLSLSLSLSWDGRAGVKATEFSARILGFGAHGVCGCPLGGDGMGPHKSFSSILLGEQDLLLRVQVEWVTGLFAALTNQAFNIQKPGRVAANWRDHFSLAPGK